METVVLGKTIQINYELNIKTEEVKDNDGCFKTVYVDKPRLIEHVNVVDHPRILSFEGEPHYNSKKYYPHILFNDTIGSLNISDKEEVEIIKKVFRADLNELHLYADKVVDTKEDLDKDLLKHEYNYRIKEFNKQMIESNDKLKAYCDLHKLVYEDTDCVKLFKLVFPNEEYVIEDGVMKVKEMPKAYGLKASSFYIDDCVVPITSSISSGTISDAVCGTISTKC